MFPKKTDDRTVARDAPIAIGMMSAVINSGGSFGTAVADVAENGPKSVSRIFRKAVRMDTLKMGSDLKEIVLGSIDSDGDLAHFKRCLRMIAAASETADPSERLGMTRDAVTAANAGLKRTGEAYAASLNNPCMMIFGLGIMVPMIMMVILPMAGIGGPFSSPFLDSGLISVITLVAVPLMIGCLIAAMAKRNPFDVRKAEIGWHLSPLLSAPVICAILYMATGDTLVSLSLGSAACCIASAVMLRPIMKRRSDTRRKCTELEHMFFDLGSGLSNGTNFERSLVSSMEARGLADISRMMRNGIVLARGDVHAAVGSLHRFSGDVAYFCSKVFHASERDLTEAGKLSAELGLQLQERSAAMKDIKVKMKNITDMMIATAMFFAPLIMSLSLVLIAPLSTFTGVGTDGSVPVMILMFIIELVLLVSVLISYIGDGDGMIGAAYMFSVMLPVAIIVFIVVSGFSI